MELNFNLWFGVIFVLSAGLIVVSDARMTINPNTVTLTGTDVVPTNAPSTSQVEMSCLADNLGSVEAVFSMYIKRESTTFAEITSAGINANQARISINAPTDIKTKSPTPSGTINNGYPSSSMLKVNYLQSMMDCDDRATYHCVVTYKPTNSDTRSVNSSATLTVNVQPSDLQLSVINVMDYSMVQNLSRVNRESQLELSCNGYIGGVQSQLIEWYRKTYQDTDFRQFYPTQAGDNIDNGVPTLYKCEYSRTSKLRYSISTADSGYTKFRCEVPGLQTTGGAFRAYSHEFHINTGFITLGNGSARLPSSSAHCTSLLLALLFILRTLV